MKIYNTSTEIKSYISSTELRSSISSYHSNYPIYKIVVDFIDRIGGIF